MRTKNISLKAFFISVFTLFLVGSGCSVHSEKWKEEVQLSDGRVIVVERETLRERGGDELVLNRSGSKPKEHRVRFPNPDAPGTFIEWKSTKRSPSTWPEVPLILDFVDGQFIVMTSVFPPRGCEMYSKYIYRNGTWTEEALPEKFEQRKTNLLIRDGIDMPKFVSLQEKTTSNAKPGYDKSLRQVGPNRQICE